MDAELYIKEKRRMLLNELGKGGEHNSLFIRLNDLEKKHPAEAVRIVEQWSKAHPIQTNAMKFEEVFGISFGTFWSMPYDKAENFVGAPYEPPKGSE